MDDLLDLSWQPTTAKAQSKQPPPSSSSSSIFNATSANASTANYYGSSSSFGASSPRKPSPAPGAASAAPPKTMPAANSDAFASLFSSSSAAKQQASLSLAERQRLAREQATKKAQDDKRRNDAMWSGIDSSSFSGSAAPMRPFLTSPPPSIAPPQRLSSPANSNAAQQSLDPWDFDAFSSTVPTSSSTSKAKPTSPSMAVVPPDAQIKATDPFDFDSFDQPFSSASTVAVDTEPGDQSDDILGALAMPVPDATKNSLSARDPRVASLSSSASTSSAGSSRVPSPASGSRPTARRSAVVRGSSPPPHLIGQIVEMGFTPQQARQALAQTDTGADLEAALEVLVGNSNALHRPEDDDERLARKLQVREQQQARTKAASFHDSYDDDFDPKEIARQIKEHGRQDSHEQHQRQRSNNDARSGAANQHSQAGADWQQQADQIYAQASEIGTSVFNKASAFWSTAKAQAQKALDEHNLASAERSTTPSDAGSDRHRARRWGAASAASKNKEWEGKPKWMVEAELALAEEANRTGSKDSELKKSANEPAGLGGFKDSDNEDEAVIPEAPIRAPRRPTAPVTSVAAGGVVAAAAAMSSAASSLFGGSRTEEALGKISRQQSPSQPPPGVAARSAAAATASKAPYASPSRSGTPSRSAAPSPIPPQAPLKRRPIPSDASHSISSANRNKEEGNEHFKRGAYGDAEMSYTRGISAIESSSSSESIRLVPLLSNRANVRLKNGDAPGTIADCDHLLKIVLSIFGGSHRDTSGRVAVYRASQEAALPAEFAEINLRETYGKALVRRAQALEANERWKLAKADWEVLLEYEKAEGSGLKTAASNMKFAREGLHRCGKMLGEKVVGPAVSSTGPPRSNARASRAATRNHVAAGEKASAAFADQQQKQAAEESAKFALKDSVDAKIDNWKRGKETNLRALLSSLDTIVWPELGWKPIALHQVLDQAGLKRNYTKAIARLHPDKIKKDATTEQKMIASAAFHAINEAWNAQQ